MNEVATSRFGRAVASAACALAVAFAALPASAQSTVAAGTQINAVLASSDLNTKNAQVGDGFTMDVVSPYPADSAYPNGDPNFAGARVRGHVASVAATGQGKPASMQLAFDSIVFANGTSRPIAGTVTKMGSKSDDTTVRKGLGAGLGAVVGSQTVGRIIGGSVGSLVGIAGGAAAGYAYAKNNKANFNLAKGAAVSLQTTTAVAVPRRQATQ